MTTVETPARIEPLLFRDTVAVTLADLSVDIQREAGELGRGLHRDSAAELADLLRMMNCYYSNLIEGHNTRPKDIELALAGAEIEPERRALALEAKAHVPRGARTTCSLAPSWPRAAHRPPGSARPPSAPRGARSA